MIKRIGSYFYRNFFDTELAFSYRLWSIFFFEALIISMLSFTVNALLGATNTGVTIQGCVNLFMIVAIFFPLPVKQKLLPPMLLAVIFVYLPFLYFLYAGYDGSVLYFATLGVFMLSFLYKGKMRIALVTLNIVIYVVAIVVQDSVPGLVVPMAFPDARVTDLLAAIVFTLLGSCTLSAYVSKAYEAERLRNVYLVNELAGKNDELEERSIRDPLTQVFNRGYLTEVTQATLDRCRVEEQNACLIMLDLDHFKEINDTFGHVVGDEILVQVARETQHQLRKSDILARYGGEEFVAVLYPEVLGNAIEVAERIRAVVECIPLPDGAPVTISLGVYEAGGDSSVDEALRQVDEYLYMAKNAGRNCVRHP